MPPFCLLVCNSMGFYEENITGNNVTFNMNMNESRTHVQFERLLHNGINEIVLNEVKVRGNCI